MGGRSHRSTCHTPPSLLHCCLSPYGKLIRDEQLPFSANLVPITLLLIPLPPSTSVSLCPSPTTARNPASQRQDRTWGPSSDVRSQANCITRPSLPPFVPCVDKGIPIRRPTTSPSRAVRRRRPRLVRTHPSTHIQYPQAASQPSRAMPNTGRPSPNCHLCRSRRVKVRE